MTSLYCILARAADTGVIFRRGPSKLVRLIGWDLKTHTFAPGQWFKGDIYVRNSDLSPDGTKLVYFAAKHHGKLGEWIAVSTPPFLTAHVLWGTIGTWTASVSSNRTAYWHCGPTPPTAASNRQAVS
jgi:hypothetical protein